MSSFFVSSNSQSTFSPFLEDALNKTARAAFLIVVGGVVMGTSSGAILTHSILSSVATVVFSATAPIFSKLALIQRGNAQSLPWYYFPARAYLGLAAANAVGAAYYATTIKVLPFTLFHTILEVTYRNFSDSAAGSARTLLV